MRSFNMLKSIFCTLFVIAITTGIIFSINSYATGKSVAKDGTEFSTTSGGDRQITHPNGTETIIDKNTGKKKITGTSN